MLENEKNESAAAGDDETEKNAHLQRLQAAAAGDAEPVTVTGETEQGLTVSDEIAALIKMAVSILKPVLPSVANLYNDETIAAASGAIGAVCDKHGWLQGGVMGQYSVEISAAFVLVPLGFATREAVLSDIENNKKNHELQKPKNENVTQSNVQNLAAVLV